MEAIGFIFVLYNFFVAEKTYIIVGVEEGNLGLRLAFLFNWDCCKQG